MNCQGGGGYGDPILRDPQSVAQDLADGLISESAIRDIYGVVLSDNGNVNQEDTDRLRADMRNTRLTTMKTAVKIDASFDPKDGRPIDDNLMQIAGEAGTKIGCRHCGQAIANEDNILHLGVITGETNLAGPGVRTDPGVFVDETVVFTQHLCPGCGTVIQSSIAPESDKPLINGFAVA